jgi:lipid II:glycine glycyltransferase (peptidoglycan interpeptide bridge formation enzyme)
MTMIIRKVPMFAYIAEQRDTRERRSIAALAAFAFQYLHTVTNSASEVLVCAVTCQANIVAAVREPWKKLRGACAVYKEMMTIMVVFQ